MQLLTLIGIICQKEVSNVQCCPGSKATHARLLLLAGPVWPGQPGSMARRPAGPVESHRPGRLARRLTGGGLLAEEHFGRTCCWCGAPAVAHLLAHRPACLCAQSRWLGVGWWADGHVSTEHRLPTACVLACRKWTTPFPCPCPCLGIFRAQLLARSSGRG